MTSIIGCRNGRPVRSAIGKSPLAAGSVFFGRDVIAGDEQTNRFLHGGSNRAVCAYDAGHWPWWRSEKGLACAEGSFGENLTLIGVNEDRVCIGDRFQWGDVILEVTLPRGPCANLDLHHGRVGVAQAITRSARCGWYMRVLREGEAPTRNAKIEHIRAVGSPTVTEAFVVCYISRSPFALRQRAKEILELSANLRRAVERNLS
ncbi:MAG TPA: MOSC domain-containing protein [Rhizomicrobium sp.]|nr:MOSC domain-containing protein [Rhizomicrobium sp.]